MDSLFFNWKLMSFVISLQGEYINFVNISDSPVHPLTSGKLASKANGSENDAKYTRNIYYLRTKTF